MKWFSIKGILEEAKKIKWPKASDLGRSTVEVLIFTISFGVFFVLCELIVSGFMNIVL